MGPLYLTNLPLKKGRLVVQTLNLLKFDDQETKLNAFSVSTIELSGLMSFIFAGRKKSVSCDL